MEAGGEVCPPRIDSGELTTEEYDGHVTPEKVKGPLMVHEEDVLKQAREGQGGGGAGEPGLGLADHELLRWGEEPTAAQGEQGSWELGRGELAIGWGDLDFVWYSYLKCLPKRQRCNQ